MDMFVSQETIEEFAAYFREHDYKKPEQLGLFLYFKSTGLNEYTFSTYQRWGDCPASRRKELLRRLYDLSGVFDVTTENGLKRTSLFPFSICKNYKASCFYNGGTVFSGLGSRIYDTLDNTLVSTFIQRGSEASQLKLASNYIDILRDRLNGQKIPLEAIAAWHFKFWTICMPDDATDKMFQDVCVLAFLLRFGISCNEFNHIFSYGYRTIKKADFPITGPELRAALKFDNDDCMPEIEEGSPASSYMPQAETLDAEEVTTLLGLCGDGLTAERILEILTSNDDELKKKAEALATPMDKAVHDYSREELLGMENKEFIFSALEMMSHHRLFNGYTLPALESREQCSLLFRHNNIHGILYRRPAGITDKEFKDGMQDDSGRPRYYADTYSIGEDEYYVSSQWRPDREDARGAFLDWLFELLLTIRFETGLPTAFERNRIVFGAPGTGKSHRLNEDKDSLLTDTSGTYERVTFHPEYTYSQFVGSYKPVTGPTGEIRYDFVPGPFMRVLVAALKSGRTESPQPHLLLIEEINRAKVAAVFGEVFQLLDRSDSGASEYEIHATEDVRKYLISELGKSPDSLRIPDNMFIWATMNSADQGVYPMDTAFKRRWSFEYIGIDENDAEVGGIVALGRGDHARDINWNQLRKAINDTLAVTYNINEDKLLGPYFLSKRVFAYGDNQRITDPERFIAAFKSKVIMYLYEDAAKSVKRRLFEGCDASKYSSVCSAFDETGIEIFGADFLAKYNDFER
jgi:MoxR-like ATPase